MWEKIRTLLDRFPAQKTVAVEMLKRGFSVSDKGGIYCGGVEVSPSKFARAIGVDRRAITAAEKTITGNPELKKLFLKFKPTLDLSEVAIENGLGVVELKGTEATKTPGVLLKITKEISDLNISIRQVIADDTGIVSDPRITIITDQKLPGELLTKLKEIPGIAEVVIK
jgi:predicted regulator of amino acid metabolism with ACT domain